MLGAGDAWAGTGVTLFYPLHAPVGNSGIRQLPITAFLNLLLEKSEMDFKPSSWIFSPIIEYLMLLLSSIWDPF